MPARRKSTAREWKQSRSPNTKYRDRGTAHLPDGSSKEVTGYGPTKAAASLDLDSKITVLESSVSQAETITVAELFAEYLEHKRSVKGAKAKTVHGDMGLFVTHIQASLGPVPLAALKLHQVQRVQHALTRAGKWRTAELATIQLKSLLSFAAKRYRAETAAGRLHLLSRDDVDDIRRPPGVTRQAGELWSRPQVRAFLALSKDRYDKQRTAVLYPLFHTALAAGLRRGELVGLGRHALKRAGNRFYLDITEQLIEYGGELHPDTPKTAAGTRKVPIPDALADVLTAHCAKMDRLAAEQGRPPSPLMFPSSVGTPLESRTIYRGLDTLAKDLKLPRSTLHQLRKVYSSHITQDLIAAGTYSPKLLAKLLGHTKADVALSVYSLVADDDFSAAVLDFDR